MTRRSAALLVAILVLQGCSNTPPSVTEPESNGLPRGRSEQATRTKPGKSGNGEAKPAGQGSGAGNQTEEEAPFVEMGKIGDGSGDAAPSYADITDVSIEQNGTNVRVNVDLAGAVPDHTPGESEVVGVAVDLFTDKGNYQLYASGENDGWFAYLYKPKGMADYPGTFAIAGTRLVFTLPWSEFGGRRKGTFSSYCEWSSAEGFSEDYAPDDSSKVPFA